MFKSMWKSNSLWHVAPARKPSFLFSLEASMDNEVVNHKFSIKWHICRTQLYQRIFFGAQIGCQSFFHGDFTSRPLAKLCFPLQSSRPPPVLETEFIGLGEGTGKCFFYPSGKHQSTQPKTCKKKWEIKVEALYVTSIWWEGWLVVLFRLPMEFFEM